MDRSIAESGDKKINKIGQEHEEYTEIQQIQAEIRAENKRHEAVIKALKEQCEAAMKKNNHAKDKNDFREGASMDGKFQYKRKYFGRWGTRSKWTSK